MKSSLRTLSDKTQFEDVLDFALESNTFDIVRFCVKPNEILTRINIPLYIFRFEQVITIYAFSKISSDFIRDNVSYSIESNDYIDLQLEFMCKFKLVRIIEPNVTPLVDSYLRVIVKNDHDNSKMINIEDERFYF